jgi:hypothetical protein
VPRKTGSPPQICGSLTILSSYFIGEYPLPSARASSNEDRTIGVGAGDVSSHQDPRRTRRCRRRPFGRGGQSLAVTHERTHQIEAKELRSCSCRRIIVVHRT